MPTKNSSLLPIANGVHNFNEKRPLSARPSSVAAVHLDVDLAIKKAHVHQECWLGNILCRDLPEFDALYQTEPKEAESRLRQEIERLKTTVNLPSSSQVLTWRDKQNVSTETLLQVVEHLSCDLYVLEYSNALIVVDTLRHCREERTVKATYESALIDLRACRRVLISRFVQASPFVVVRELKTLSPGTIESSVFDDLVDYITACIYRHIYRSAAGTTWNHVTLAVLARMSRKLKDLKSTAQSCAEDCLSATDGLHDDLKDEHSELRKPFTFRVGDDWMDLLDDSLTLDDYFVEEYQYRNQLCAMFHTNLSAIKREIVTRDGVPLHEDCTFSTLLQGAENESAVVIDTERGGHMSTTTLETNMTIAYHGCQLLLRLVEHLNSGKEKPDSIQRSAVFAWWSTEAPPGSMLRTVYVDNLADCVSMIVHISLTRSWVANQLTRLAESILRLPGEDNKVLFFPRPSSCRLGFTFSGPGTIPAIDTVHTNRTMMSVASYSLNQRFVEASDDYNITPGVALRREYKKVEERMQGWLTDGGAIVIRCRKVVLLILLPTLLIMLAGVVLLVAPYRKPKGVDPSNFMIFLWSIALSFLLVAKAFYVPDWPWHDFLRAKIYCRGVNEVTRVTGIRKELVILHLLAHQRELAIPFKGPYDLLFAGAPPEVEGDVDKQGAPTAPSASEFAIDAALSLDAVYGSGYSVLKAMTLNGPRLVFLDSREGSTEYFLTGGNIPRKHVVAEEQWQTTVRRTMRQPKRYIKLYVEQIQWLHATTEGFYVNRDAEFV